MMSIPSEIVLLVDGLNQELDRTEEEAREGLNLVRPLLSLFSGNVRVLQFYTFFNNALLFVEISRRRIQAIVERISAADVTAEEIQEAGEDLGMLLGRLIEAKMVGRQLLRTLEELR